MKVGSLSCTDSRSRISGEKIHLLGCQSSSSQTTRPGHLLAWFATTHCGKDQTRQLSLSSAEPPQKQQLDHSIHLQGKAHGHKAQYTPLTERKADTAMPCAWWALFSTPFERRLGRPKLPKRISLTTPQSVCLNPPPSVSRWPTTAAPVSMATDSSSIGRGEGCGMIRAGILKGNRHGFQKYTQFSWPN